MTDNNEDLEALRGKIDGLDRQIIGLLNERVKLAREVGRVKAETGSEIYVPSREEEVIQKLAAVSEGPLDEKAVRAIYRQIISAAIALERPITIAYLGPEATFTHQAAMKNFGESLAYQPYETIPGVFEAVEQREADYGVIPIENSSEGAVSHSYEMLVETDLKIVAQVYLEIAHCLISLSPLEKITRVLSKDNALGQCRQWLRRHLPAAELADCPSTARAVQHAREHSECAAVAGEVASVIYGVPAVASNIQDTRENITRFLVIGKKCSPPMGRGRDKTSLVFSLQDQPGALLRALQAFSFRGINMSKIESRPSRQKLWDYYFFVDIIGHIEDPVVQEAVAEMEKACPLIKWLGSYPNT